MKLHNVGKLWLSVEYDEMSIININNDILYKDIKSIKSNIKRTSAYRGSADKYRVDILFYKVLSDIWVSSQGNGQSYGNISRYMIVFIDDYTNYRSSYTAKTKGEVSNFIKEYIKINGKQWGYPIKIFHTEKDGEFFGYKVRETLQENGVKTRWGDINVSVFLIEHYRDAQM